MVALDLLMIIVAALLFGAGMGATRARAPRRLIAACYASSGLVIVLAALTIRIP
jgi:L-asparaginase II